jgi:transposase
MPPEARWATQEWEAALNAPQHERGGTSLRSLARIYGCAHSTIHRWVNQDVRHADRRRSQRRRERARRFAR